jgi:hypothetical protein
MQAQFRRAAEFRREHFSEIAAEFVRLKVDVIVSSLAKMGTLSGSSGRDRA